MENKNEEQELSESIKQLNRTTKQLVRQQTLWYGFVHGIIVGIGSTVGVALVLAFILLILRRLEFVPVIGDFVEKIVPYVQKALQR